jgi:hypothetical protein
MKKMLVILLLVGLFSTSPFTLFASEDAHPPNDSNLGETITFIITVVVGLVVRWWEKWKMKRDNK